MKIAIEMVSFPTKNVIFPSYVSLPEGNCSEGSLLFESVLYEGLPALRVINQSNVGGVISTKIGHLNRERVQRRLYYDNHVVQLSIV